jgi:hypothetical protein
MASIKTGNPLILPRETFQAHKRICKDLLLPCKLSTTPRLPLRLYRKNLLLIHPG